MSGVVGRKGWLVSFHGMLEWIYSWIDDMVGMDGIVEMGDNVGMDSRVGWMALLVESGGWLDSMVGCIGLVGMVGWMALSGGWHCWLDGVVGWIPWSLGMDGIVGMGYMVGMDGIFGMDDMIGIVGIVGMVDTLGTIAWLVGCHCWLGGVVGWSPSSFGWLCWHGKLDSIVGSMPLLGG